VWSSSSTEPRGGEAANPLQQSDAGSSPAPHELSAQSDRRDENETREDQPLSEGNYDHALGKTTAVEPDGLRLSVVVNEDGSLRWSGDPQKGEQGFLDDCQALVDVGIATWLERPA
jgi:hypothetical protein